MWRFQWLFVLLFYRVRSLPTTNRRYHRSGAGVILLRLCLSGFQFSFATDRLHYIRVIESKISVSNLNQISQNQIWDPGISKFEFGDDGRKLGLDITKQRQFLLYSTIMISYPSVRKQFTISREVGVLFLSMSNLKDLGITLRLDLIHKRRLILYLTVMGASLTFRKRITMSGAFDVRFLSVWIWVDDATWLRIRETPSRNYWAEMAFPKAMGMIPHLQERLRRRHNTSSRSSFLFQREADVLTMTSKSRQELKVMLKAFWSLSYMLLAINIKYMKGGSISHSLIARKAYVQQAGLIHSIIEATASHICEKRLYPSSLSLLYERICVFNLVYPNDVLFCY